MYAFWALRGHMPDVVDSWPVDWSGGWLLERAMELKYDAEKWKGQPIGWGLDDPDHDPAFDADPSPPAGWESLPFHEPDEEV